MIILYFIIVCSSATAPYEVLGRTDKPNAYDDLTQEKGIFIFM